MTTEERIDYLTRLTDESDIGVLTAYLDTAIERVLDKMYPFGTEETDVPPKYEHSMLDIAVYLLNKRGAEGQVTHSENGIARTYESADIPKSMLQHIIPKIGVIG